MNTSAPQVLVTGASGFIGRHLCRSLRQQGDRVRAMSRGGAPDQAAGASGLQWIQADLTQTNTLASACSGINIIYHLAGIAHVNPRLQADYRRVVVQGTENLVRAAAVAGVRRLVFCSSSLAATAEQDPAQASDYGRTKLAAEKILQDYATAHGIEISILRPVNVYGPGMKGNLATMIRLIKRRQLPPLPRLANRISLVGVEDLCRALMLVATADRAAGRTYLVSDGQAYGINAVEAAVYAALGRKKPGWHMPRVVLYAAAAMAELTGSGIGRKTYANLVNDNLFDGSALQYELGFKPEKTLYDELPAILAAL